MKLAYVLTVIMLCGCSTVHTLGASTDGGSIDGGIPDAAPSDAKAPQTEPCSAHLTIEACRPYEQCAWTPRQGCVAWPEFSCGGIDASLAGEACLGDWRCDRDCPAAQSGVACLRGSIVALDDCAPTCSDIATAINCETRSDCAWLRTECVQRDARLCAPRDNYTLTNCGGDSIGYRWNGSSCVRDTDSYNCDCVGEHCDDIYGSLDACLHHHNACNTDISYCAASNATTDCMTCPFEKLEDWYGGPKSDWHGYCDIIIELTVCIDSSSAEGLQTQHPEFGCVSADDGHPYYCLGAAAGTSRCTAWLGAGSSESLCNADNTPKVDALCSILSAPGVSKMYGVSP